MKEFNPRTDRCVCGSKMKQIKGSGGFWTCLECGEEFQEIESD